MNQRLDYLLAMGKTKIECAIKKKKKENLKIEKVLEK